MSKVLVELVKYDTQRTKKRKRADLLVDEKTVESVIEKLEKIHKGDKVIEVFEVIWGEELPVVTKKRNSITGRVKFFDADKGFGFIAPGDNCADLFFHASALDREVVYDDELVEFEKSESPKGEVAIHIKVIDED